ncbi:helix-turn-helix transcriptional regulator [Halobacillus sp. BAB-2008]|uniref:helix-turn-helix transcriptional regulator n=1 Tax=Halobacillus sp. BAB-2008 TaxID=1246484 RepID=UPI0002A4E817|nr:helix-turn-helix transcriptional regulator [Halobacillus sp. BAB-2008]ELK46188.1 transcriptional regulator [Halobacillus sp. BAB-2008]
MRMWLKEIRLQKDLTQEQTANKSNISRSYYTHIESGVKNPTVETAKDIAFTLEFKWTNFFENQCSLKEQKTYKEML